LSLFKKSVEGASWLGISNFLVAFLQFLIIIVLSRYLSKSEIGNLAIIQGIIGLIMIFLDYGINNALVFVEKPTQNEISTLYWVNILVGLFLTIIVFL
jgi:O-antigen/teichoic acid export membrane protein